MSAASDATPLSPRETAEVLTELVRDSLRVLLPVTAALTWAWALVVLYAFPAHTVHAYVVIALVAGTLIAGYRLQQRRLELAVGAYLLGLAAAVTTIALAFGGLAPLYLYLILLPVAAMLTSSRMTSVVAVASAALVLALGLSGHRVPLAELLLPVMIIFLAALSLWLSSRRLHTALAWALNMTREARKSAELARRHRAEVRRVLKSLDEAYVRLERANEALIFAREAAEKAYRFKAEFVASVSHELRTPLNLIVGFSEMIATAPESYGGVLLPAQYRGDVTAIYRSARHLSDLINDVLDLSRIEAGSMPLVKETAALEEVAQEAAEMVRGLAEARGLRLELEVEGDLPRLRLDRTRIRQVLLNLLTNATRFTDRGWIRVHIRRERDEAVLTVQDSGQGIPADRLARAFDAFSQFDQERGRGGSGLGLAVSRKFVELHGGRMWVDSVPGQGTTVGFALPLRAARDSTAAPRPSAVTDEEQAGQPLVLVLHDDARTLTLLQRYVDGCRFVQAATIAEARSVVASAFPAAVLADPDWGGMAVTTADLGVPAGTPLVTCPLPSMRRLGAVLGANDYLAKPVSRDDLVRALDRLPRPPETALIVDDDAHVVRLLARMLKACRPSVRVFEAYSGRAALDVARAQRPDLALMDLYMPEFSGYDLLEEVKRDPALASLQVIVVSVRPVEYEETPIRGDVRLAREEGFSLTDIVQLLQGVLPPITRRSSAAPANVAKRPTGHPGAPVW